MSLTAHVEQYVQILLKVASLQEYYHGIGQGLTNELRGATDRQVPSSVSK